MKGYKLARDEFSDSLRRITLMGYGLVMLAHAEIKNIRVDDETTIEKIQPLLDKRPLDIVNQLVDLIGYIDMSFDTEGNSTRNLITRRTANIVAGSRFPHLPARIPFGYDELVTALNYAIDQSAQQDGAVIVDKAEKVVPIIPDRPFEEVQNDARELWTALVEANTENAEYIMDKVEEILGERKKLSEITPKQKDLFELLVIEMRAM